jgi:hypothetical protein
MSELLAGVGSDIIFLSVVFIAAAVAAFMLGTQIVSEFGLALVVASFLSTLAAGKVLAPSFVQTILGFLPIPIEVTFFLLMLAFSFWAVQHSSSGLDDTKRIPKVIAAALGVALVSVFVVTRIVPMHAVFAFGPFLQQFFTGESSLLYILIAGITAIAFSRKV